MCSISVANRVTYSASRFDIFADASVFHQLASPRLRKIPKMKIFRANGLSGRLHPE